MVMEYGFQTIPAKILINMKVNIKMTVKVVSECIDGKMELYTKANS